jgi:protein-S-isoprenylcysteine O-methyltransferase Ste14
VVSIFMVAALDDGRYHWSHVPWWTCGIGYVLLLAGLAGMAWAESVNWALVPAVLSCGLLVVRTVLEDRTLKEELPGYKEYAQRVWYRLVPGVW